MASIAKTVWVRGNPAQIATLVSGDTQIAYGGAPTAMAAAVGGRDMKIIASLSSRENLDLVARPGIQSAKDLRGKRFGVQSRRRRGVENRHRLAGTFRHG